jgi:DNA-binding MarR family transcriptional regulator
MTRSLAKRQDTVNKGAARSRSRTPAGDALSELVVQVFRLDGLLAATGDSLAEPAGQTSARWRVLATVEDGPSTVAQVARSWGLARQSVQRVADVLVEEGYCSYEENPEHRRAQLLRITARGHRALRTIQSAQRAWADALGEEIGEADLRKANAVLGRAFRAISGQEQGSSPDTVRREPGDR